MNKPSPSTLIFTLLLLLTTTNQISSFIPPPLRRTASLFISSSSSSSLLSSGTTTPTATTTTDQDKNHNNDNNNDNNNILILDHLNINHEKNRHDLLRAFYFDFLNCTIDPRKQKNLVEGRKTVWANIGCQQFHLPEGDPHPQVFDGVMTLAYPSLDPLRRRYEMMMSGGGGDEEGVFEGTMFRMTEETNDDDDDDDDDDGSSSSCCLHVTDPWGSQFRIIADPEGHYADRRGSQPGGNSEGLGMIDLTVHVSPGTNVGGIARFYSQVMGAPVLSLSENKDDEGRGCCVVIGVGPNGQTLRFCTHPEAAVVHHEDLSDDGASNYGAHVSLYVRDLKSVYERADALGVAYVNTRFKRRAYNLEEALNDCMFRVLDIVDPEDEDGGVILKLEHEIRSVVTRDGGMYKSCPFDEIPVGCR